MRRPIVLLFVVVVSVACTSVLLYASMGRPITVVVPKDVNYHSGGATAPISSPPILVAEPIPTIPLVVVGAYFHGEVDPQRKSNKYTPTCVEYFRGWYDSLHKHGIHGVLMHNGLNETAVRELETDTFKFVRVEKSHYNRNMRPNEWRMLALLDLMQNHSEWEYVMATDVLDVRFNSNPVVIMRNITGRDIFFSTEEEPQWVWVHRSWKGCDVIDRTDEKKLLYNCGVFGGKREAMIAHMKIVAPNLMRMAEHTGNSTGVVCDMIAHNKAIHEFWMANSTMQERMWDGDGCHPLFSFKFKGRTTPYSNYSVVHKKNGKGVVCPQ